MRSVNGFRINQIDVFYSFYLSGDFIKALIGINIQVIKSIQTYLLKHQGLLLGWVPEQYLDTKSIDSIQLYSVIKKGSIAATCIV